MKVEFKSKYVSYTNSKDGDIVEILDGGIKEPQKSKFSDKEEMIIVLKVMHKGQDSTFSLYERYKKPLVDAWGDETLQWVGKQFSILHVNEKMEVRPLAK